MECKMWNNIKDKIRKIIYNKINPMYYQNAEDRVINAFTNKNYNENNGSYVPTPEGYSVRDDIFATYLQIPESKRHNVSYAPKVKNSEYKPTIGGENKQYKKIDLNPIDSDALIIEALKTNTSKVSSVLGDYFGLHTIGHGFDNKGEYVSYYDKWDINPTYGASIEDGSVRNKLLQHHFKNLKGEDVTHGIGKPIDFYDRIYLNDYFDVQPEIGKDEYYGGYIRPAFIGTQQKDKSGYSVTTNDYDELNIPINKGRLLKSGGKIYIKPENRGKFTALKKRTGKSASWFKAHGTPAQKKMATFALNAKKWKHKSGGNIPNWFLNYD